MKYQKAKIPQEIKCTLGEVFKLNVMFLRNSVKAGHFFIVRLPFRSRYMHWQSKYLVTVHQLAVRYLQFLMNECHSLKCVVFFSVELVTESSVILLTFNISMNNFHSVYNFKITPVITVSVFFHFIYFLIQLAKEKIRQKMFPLFKWVI